MTKTDGIRKNINNKEKSNKNKRKNSDNKREIKNNRNNKKRIKWIITVVFGILLPITLFCLVVNKYNNKNLLNNTVIDDVINNLTDEESENTFDTKIKTYSLTILGRNGLSDTIYGDEIALHTVYDNNISRLIENTDMISRPTIIILPKELQIASMVSYDEELLKEAFHNLSFFEKENVLEPENAQISGYGIKGYEMIPEIPGAKILEERFYEAVLTAVNALQPSLSIEEAGCYKEPKLISTSPELLRAMDEMNRIAGAKIRYELGENIEVLDGTKISEWITVDQDFQVHFDYNGVTAYVDYIGKTYNSFGRTREFVTSYGEIIDIKGGDYGWWLNRPAEVAELTELIENGEQVTKIPVYLQTAQQYGIDDIGDTYVEVNLTAQHLFYYKEGELILETDFVSGNISKDYGTPVGTYPVQYRQNDATLVGEDYATPVKYWMPFNKNIGFHDATWRKEFGKDIYLTNGSHGCINMPPKAAKKMFKYIKRGVAVVVYELPGTENYEIEPVDQVPVETEPVDQVPVGVEPVDQEPVEIEPVE